VKNLSLSLPVFLLLSTSAQTQIVDTSILKNGNTWLYSRQESGGGGLGANEAFTYSGTVKFTLDSVELAGDTLKFRVTQEDTGARTSNWYGATNPHTLSTTRYALRNNTFSPNVPLFASGQAFSGSESKAVYRGDTVLFRTTPPDNFNNCAPRRSTNLEGVGRTEDTYSYQCGHTYGSQNFRLKEYNGVAYSPESLTVVTATAIRPGFKKLTATSAGMRLQKNQVIFSDEKSLYDLRGQRMPTAIRR
jgi:hypothetical protein